MNAALPRDRGARALDDLPHEEARLLRDVVPTGWFGADMADVQAGSSVAVFGCGPVGLFAIVAARLRGAGRIFAVDGVPARLERARQQGAQTIDFEQEDPVETILRLTEGQGVERVIDVLDATAVEPEPLRRWRPALPALVLEPPVQGTPWAVGGSSSLMLEWSVEVAAKAGTIAIVGADPPAMGRFPIGAAMIKQLKIAMGSCNPGRYVPELVALVRKGTLRPTEVLARPEPSARECRGGPSEGAR